MYILPKNTPQVTAALMNDCEDVDILLSTLENYILSFPVPDHFNNPIDYVYATFYLNKVKDFYEIIKYERANY